METFEKVKNSFVPICNLGDFEYFKIRKDDEGEPVSNEGFKIIDQESFDHFGGVLNLVNSEITHLPPSP